MSERILDYRIPPDSKGGRADKLFADHFDDVSRARLQKAFEAGRVTCNDEVIDKRHKVGPGAVLRAVLDEPDAEGGPEAVDIALKVVFEDASIIVVNKPAGMVTHPGSGTGQDTLVHALLHHCGGSLSSIGAPDRPGIVHRLDKETSGLIVVAKTDAAHHRLAKAFSERETFKRYRALVLGTPKKRTGSCHDPIGRHRVVRTRMAIVPSGREAHTDWAVDETYGGLASLLSCIIHTGRTHQIRVHMAGMKHPILGDTTYGFNAKRLPGIVVPRIMLHATELKLNHPESGKVLHFEAPLPEDFLTLMEQMRI